MFLNRRLNAEYLPGDTHETSPLLPKAAIPDLMLGIFDGETKRKDKGRQPKGGCHQAREDLYGVRVVIVVLGNTMFENREPSEVCVLVEQSPEFSVYFKRVFFVRSIPAMTLLSPRVKILFLSHIRICY
jgi:hypothetical protein